MLDGIPRRGRQEMLDGQYERVDPRPHFPKTARPGKGMMMMVMMVMMMMTTTTTMMMIMMMMVIIMMIMRC
ncbi:hypothetical protein DPMN_159565 [Dreissena polymorpha]|uniref:Uncharacterized protein n=1 Tax=Dreissena polymorpha TaxID=45954 RepID=A0A9D4ELN3_DREPO|nr:hypothetical protein DPMN_159565 [Dreissena polymorpha]